ncbi:MAG: translation elongation factor Ts [Clostridia bacterium]
MAFTAQDVKKLREQTNAGMMDCKKALTEANGDFQGAVEYLREKGLAAAAKKAGRVAAEGMVVAKTCENGIGAILEVNSETDFVSKNAEFQKFTSDLADVIINENPADVEALAACAMDGKTVAEVLTDKILTIGEKLEIRRFVRKDAETVNVPYIHMGGRIGVLVSMKVSENIKGNEAVVTLGKDVCMQIAAMRPAYLCRSEVESTDLEKEREILLAQALNEGKPQNIAEKMVAGRINKFYEENCLLDQAYVKENKISVSAHAAAVAKEIGGEIEIVAFTRFETGEGIEKKEDNFAAEVAQMSK